MSNSSQKDIVGIEQHVSAEFSDSLRSKIQTGIIAGGMSVSPLGLAATLQWDNVMRIFSLNPEGLFTYAGAAVAFTSLMVFPITKMFYTDNRNEKIYKAIAENPKSLRKANKALEQAKKERTLVSSFNIRDKVEIDINSLRKKPIESVADEEATHTVHHYAIREGNAYRIEQEVIPNEETLWDLSADALVEVYGVKETKSIEA